MKVVIIYDAGGEGWTSRDVAAVRGNVNDVRDILRNRGHDVESVAVRLGNFRWLSRCRSADLVFNLCEGVGGVARHEDSVVAALELSGTPFTGPRSWPIAVCHRKHVANTLLMDAGLPVPTFLLAEGNRLPADTPLPAIVKPAAEDASIGIDAGAVCTTRKALRQRVSAMLEHHDDVLVQTVLSLINLGSLRAGVVPGNEGEADPEQLRQAIEGVRALLPLIEPALGPDAGQIRDAVSRLQMEYARLASGATAPPAQEQPAAPEGEQEEQPKPEGPGPAESSGRLWVPGR